MLKQSNSDTKLITNLWIASLALNAGFDVFHIMLSLFSSVESHLSDLWVIQLFGFITPLLNIFEVLFADSMFIYSALYYAIDSTTFLNDMLLINVSIFIPYYIYSHI